jgi:WD40 repeat protein
LDQVRELATLGEHEAAVACLAISPDGRTIAAGLMRPWLQGDPPWPEDSIPATVVIWDALDRIKKGEIRGHTSDVVSVAFSRDSGTLATASLDGTVRLWDVESVREIQLLRGHKDCVNCVRYSPDGSWLASGSTDGTVIVWDVATSRRQTLLPIYSRVHSLAFCGDSEILATSSEDGVMRLWDVRSGKLRQVRLGHTTGVLAVSFSDNQRDIATGSRDGIIKQWDVGKNPPEQSLSRQAEPVNAFNPQVSTMVAARSGGEVLLLDLQTNVRSQTVLVPATSDPQYQPAAFAFSNSGTKLALWCKDGLFAVWDIVARKEIAKSQGDAVPVHQATFFDDDRLLLIVPSSDPRREGKRITVRDAATLELRDSFDPGEGPVASVDVHPGGKVVAIGRSGQGIDIVELFSWRRLRTLQGQLCWPGARFSADGTLLASANDDRTACIWDWANGKLIHRLVGHVGG